MVTRWLVTGIFCLILLHAAPAAAEELYQYKDQNGHMHFTDDLSDVPENQRPKIKSFQEIPPSKKGNASDDNQANHSNSQKSAPSGSTWNGKLEQKADSLEKQRNALNRKYEKLRSEKQALEPPPASASHAEKREYQSRVEELNRKITAYKKQKKQFEEQVFDFKDKTRGTP